MPRRKVDLAALDPSTRARVERIIEPRDTPLGLRFRAASVAVWRKRASARGVSLTEWIERALDAAARK